MSCPGRHCEHDLHCHAEQRKKYEPTPPFAPISIYSCTCGRAWSSILPPPPCPVHGPFENHQVISIDVTSRTSPYVAIFNAP